MKNTEVLSFFDKYNGNITSQNGENLIINECIKRIGLIGGIAIEFGAPTKRYYSNIYHLSDSLQWACIYYDDDPKEDGINKLIITEKNVNDLPPCTIISMDTDGDDYWLWQAYKGKPDIVIIEINSGFHAKDEAICVDNCGTSYRPMVKLGIEKGYFLLCHTGNLIFVRNEYKDLFPEINKDPLTEYEYYFRTWFLFDHIEKWEEKR